jgi:hypothetical protein
MLRSNTPLAFTLLLCGERGEARLSVEGASLQLASPASFGVLPP